MVGVEGVMEIDWLGIVCLIGTGFVWGLAGMIRIETERRRIKERMRTGPWT